MDIGMVYIPIATIKMSLNQIDNLIYIILCIELSIGRDDLHNSYLNVGNTICNFSELTGNYIIFMTLGHIDKYK